MIVDVTHHTHFRGEGVPTSYNHLHDLVRWLSDNVGEYHGRGDGDVLRVGSGWEIIAIREQALDARYTVNILVDIDDGPNATWFAIQWGK